MEEMNEHLRFNTHIGQEKPFTIDKRDAACPFCDRSQLADILEEHPPIVYLKNKFPVLEDTYQTVIIETDACDAELSTYAPAHLHAVMRFGVEKWLEMARSGDFASVVFYKNHGPHSGGSLRHPHMQIVGLNRVDYRNNVRERDFEGLAIAAEEGVRFNLSTHPRMGFTEFNVLLSDPARIDRMADYVQVAAHYVLNHFHAQINSYNLFFYETPDGIAAKLIPRFIVGPLFVGFSIPQVTNRLDEIVQVIQERYFERDA
jgi:ATP adenylyltransferase/5',5'''-P-1,P-4-tetraphosphate phosphorylase II